MSAVVLDKNTISDYKKLIPGELYAGTQLGMFSCIGGIFLEEPVGALVYEELSGGGALIRSIYVDEDFRRLDIATEMMEELGDRRVFFTYEATGDRASLEPFFDSMDIDTVRIDCPMCYMSLKTVEERMKKAGVFKVKEAGSTFADLTPAQRIIALRWMTKNCNERGEAYEWVHPDSVFLIEDEQVRACVLLSDMEDGLLSVDLVFSDYSDSRKLMGLFAHLIINVRIDYPGDTDVRMIMTTKDGQQFYEKLFGYANYMVPVITAA